jgi:hypothetical protein
MTASICYFPTSETEATTQISKSIASPAKPHSDAIHYFPEDDELAEVVNQDVVQPLTVVVARLREQIQSELLLQADYGQAIATLEEAEQDSKILESIIAATISATVQKIQENPAQIQLTYPQSPWLPGYLKQLSSSLFEQTPDTTEADYEQEKYLKLVQIGKLLKTTRERKNISRNQLHQQTHVLVSHIEAIEEERFETLPEDLYVKGFIRRLGEGLGLNGIALAATLPQPKPMVRTKPLQEDPTWTEEAARYVGYATLIMGAVGGLSWTLAQKQPNAIPLDPSLSESPAANQLTQNNKTQTINQSIKNITITSPESLHVP